MGRDATHDGGFSAVVTPCQRRDKPSARRSPARYAAQSFTIPLHQQGVQPGFGGALYTTSDWCLRLDDRHPQLGQGEHKLYAASVDAVMGSITRHGFWWSCRVTQTVHQALLREAPGQWCVLRQPINC